MEDQLLRVYLLKLELLRSGYQGYQVDVIVRAAIGNNLPEEVGSEERSRLISILEGYLDIALKRSAHGSDECP